jgi:ATP-dependent Clp protease adaptor protein ClpS
MAGPTPGKGKPQAQPGGDVLTEKRTERKLQKPPLYKVVLHNDDYTPMEFVVRVLIEVFHKSESDANAIMLHAHTRGAVVAGVYTYEIAEAKVAKVAQLAREAEHPLLATMEPE